MGKPSAVVQYKDYKGGGIIAVNYEARYLISFKIRFKCGNFTIFNSRAFGVTRNMRGDDAKAKCADIILVKVPESRGKADLTKYRKMQNGKNVHLHLIHDILFV